MRKKRLFGTCGIRGPIKNKVTPELIFKLGLALANYIKGGKVVIARDSRTSGEMLQHAATAGLLAGGCDVIDIGLAPTPCMAFTTRELGADAGAMLTASHNPSTDNGIKFHNQDGMEYLPKQELDIETLLFGKRLKQARWDSLGSVNSYPDAVSKYVKATAKAVKVKPGFKVVVDCASGAASVVTPYLLRELGCRVTSLNSNPDGHFPGHPLEPQPWNLGDLMRTVKEVGADVGFAHDGDGDRIVAVDERGEFVKHDSLIALFAKRAAEARKGTVITSINTSVVIEDIVKQAGSRIVRTKLGNLHAEMIKHDTIYAGEPGKLIFPEFGRWMDGIFGVGKMLELMTAERKPLSEIVGEIPDYPMHRENFPCPDERKASFMRGMRKYLLKEVDQVKNTIDIDGVRVNRANGSWLLVRVSGTEPKARMVLEGRTKGEADKLRKTGRDGIEKLLKRKK
ncbi:MAG: phosphoglucosamine mutase [Candidatus Hadarchaeota archaeon]|nr:phosphoglucosamine mutase [Candidatus Hadarchaeota archaeon]